MQQKRLDARRLLQQDFFHQIIHNKVMVAGERVDEGRGVFVSLHRECRQLEPGDPAFGAGFQSGDVLC